MKSLKSVLAGAAVLAIAGAGIAMNATSAFADTPNASITGDPNASLGTVSFYNAAGTQITSGSLSSLQYTYAVASTDKDRAATTNQKATVFYALPDHTQADSQNWFSSQATTATNFPVTTAGAPASITGLGANRPVNTMKTGDSTLAGFLSSGVMDTTAGWANFVQVRLADTGTGQATRTAPFWQAVIQVDTSAGTWTQMYPHFVASTTTSLVASPNPSTVGDTVTLTATETPAAAGSVQFMDGTSNIGSPVAVNASGVATTTTSTLAQGSRALSAVFSPTDTTSFSGSTGTFTATVNPPATHTTTTLAIGGSPTVAGSDTTLTATVKDPSAAPVSAGTVSFFDSGSTTALPGTVDGTTTPGTYVLDLPAGFSAGSHSIVAKFAPTSLTQFAVSQSAPSSFLTQAPAVGACAQPGSVCTDTQYIQATVPVGTLVISTPYVDANHALNLGTLQLSPDSTQLQGHATFANIVVTDTRSGNLPWTVSALASNLSDGGTNANSVINNQNLGLTAITATPGTGFTGTVTPTANPAAAGVAPGAPGSAGLGGTTAHTVAAANHGLGTVTMQGTLSLNAPSSTEPGLFAGTITFTVG